MKSYLLLAAMCLLGTGHAVDMIHYQPGPGVEPAFFDYIKQLYASTEDPSATQSFYDYFQPPGNLTVLNDTAIGYDAIIALKFKLNPPEGYKHWNHMPNITNVTSQTSSKKVYYVQGVIQTTWTTAQIHNCSEAYFKSHFTILKDGFGNPELVAHGGGLVIYEDFVVDPPNSPTNIPCRASG